MQAIMLSAMLAVGQAGAPPAGAANAQSIDGTWTVLTFEKNGQAVQDAKNMTVTIRDNTVHFSGGDQQNKQKAMRLQFGANGTVRITEVDAPGQDRQGQGGQGQGGQGQGGQGTTRPTGADQAKSGVYVFAKDYLAICVHDEKSRNAPGQAGQGQAGQGQGGQGAGGTAGAGSPQSQWYCTVILTRSDSRERDRQNRDKR